MQKLALVGLAVLLAGSASAADMRIPAKAPAPTPVVTYHWTGCYVGAGGGYGMFDQESQFIDTGVAVGLTSDNGGRGWFGTVQVGCDYQVGSSFVIGVFGDYDFASIKGNMHPAAFGGGGLIGEEKLKSSWAAGGRIGWLPFQSQQLLVYVSGGYTQARFDAVDFTSIFGGGVVNTMVKHTYDGYFIGSGYEYQLSWFPGLTWKTEYRFADYGTERVQMAAGTFLLPNDHLDNRKYVQTIRSELVWRFNFGGPVVARY
jgi:outer membrane immunogenic protein